MLITPGDSLGLLLSLHAGITLTTALGTRWEAGAPTWTGHMQNNHLIHWSISLTPVIINLYNEFVGKVKLMGGT